MYLQRVEVGTVFSGLRKKFEIADAYTVIGNLNHFF